MPHRPVPHNQTVFDQVDFFGPDFFTRIEGLTPAQVSVRVFYRNTLLDWTLIPGVAISDGQIRSGSVYWTEVAPGVYGVRWRPHAIGYWRLLFAYPAGAQEVALGYDVWAEPPTPFVQPVFR